MRHWDDTWMEVAQVIAFRSLCTRAKVGCVIVTSENRIVATAYNGPPHGFDHRDLPCTEWCDRGRTNGEVQTCPSSHAEQNAFMAADRSTWQHGVLFVTGHVCTECAKLIANSDLSRIVVQPDAQPREYRNSDDSYKFIRSLGIGVEIWRQQTPPDPDSLPTIFMEGHNQIQVKTVGGQWMNVVR